jgi:NDP-sugar pyrophosphorylase family protein/putative flippase GtrA
MQVVIPMSGFGERFRQAGYAMPKPLICVDGKPIISHVVDLYPSAERFVFVCNKQHLANPDYGMIAAIRECAPHGEIVAIDPHHLGPVHAALQAADKIDPVEPVVVNYCDFTCYWDFEEFKRFVAESECDGAVPAYKGFHPHSLGSTYYAYIAQRDLWMTAINEKEPFTDKPMEEYASSGAYYFRTGALCLDALRRTSQREDLKVNGEHYVSLAYRVLLENGKKVAVYPIQHFMQWGTPPDLEQYQGWSNVFRKLAADNQRRARHSGAILIPMAGLGKRFADEGYDLPKPLIPVSGRPMVIQATQDLPDAPVHRFVLRGDMTHLTDILSKLRASFTGAEVKVLDRLTEGQAITCLEGLSGLDLWAPVTISACDNGVLYDTERFKALMEDETVDAFVWVVRAHADGKARPKLFGWVDADEQDRVIGVAVKRPLVDPATDPMIIGTFTFKRASDFKAAADRMIARDGRVNGEFYVDSLIEDALALGSRIKLLEVRGYIGWGTPNDLRTFEYWQSCFHKWRSHPYRLEKDRRIPTAKREDLAARYAHISPPLPGGVVAERVARARANVRKEAVGEMARFVPVGALAVALDLFVYGALTSIGVATGPAKATGFVSGAVLSFFGNRNFTFRRRTKQMGVVLFALVYLASLLVNVAVNEGALALLGSTGPELGATARAIVAVLLATGASATVNFVGMKAMVFCGAAIRAPETVAKPARETAALRQR